MEGTLFPKLQGKKKTSGSSIRLSASLTVQNQGGFEPWALEAFFERTGRRDGQGDMFLTLARDHSLPQEGYRLLVKEDGIRVEASSEQGVIWALTTAAFFLDREMLPQGQWEDRPVSSHRGLYLDVVHRFFPVVEVKHLIEAMSLGKLNVLHLKLTGDQAFRIRSEAFPQLCSGGEAYSLTELRYLALYARSRGVELLPELDLPGQAGAILKAMPQLGCSTNSPSAGHTLCAGKTQATEMAKNLLKEVVPLFPGERIHLGGRWTDLEGWRSCPQCQNKMIAMGSVSVVGLQGYFIGKCCQVLEKEKKTAVVWNDALSYDLPKGVQVQIWNPSDKTEIHSFIDRGGQWIASDVYDLFLNFPAAMTPLSKVYKIQPPLGKKTKGMLGWEAALPTDQVGSFSQAQELLFPRLYAMGEVAWSGVNPGSYKDFTTRLETALLQPLFYRLTPAKKEAWDPEGSGRKKEAVDYARSLQGQPWPWLPKGGQPAPGESVEMFKHKFFHTGDLILMPRGIL